MKYYVTGEQLSVGDRVANGVGTLTSLFPIPGAKYVGKYGTEGVIDAGGWVLKQFGKNEKKQVASKLPLKVNLQLFADKQDENDLLYHYTDLEGAEAISNSGVTRANRGKVYLTDEKVNIIDANAILFAGERPEFVITHRIEVKLKNDYYHLLDVETQSNELIFRGSIRNGKHADFNVKENDF